MCGRARGLGCFAGGGWLVGPRAGWVFCGRPRGVVSCLVFCGRGIGVVCRLVSVWVSSRERLRLCEVCGWVGDVEGVAFAQELFGLVCGDDATTDGRPC